MTDNMLTNQIEIPTLQLGFGYHKWYRDLRKIAANNGISDYLGMPGYERAFHPKLNQLIKDKLDAPEPQELSSKEFQMVQSYRSEIK